MSRTINEPITEINEDVLEQHIREVTDEEVEFYNENGWVKLSGLMSPELAALILEHVQMAAGYKEGEGFTNAWNSLDPRGTRTTAWYSTNLSENDDVLAKVAGSRTLAQRHGRLIGSDHLRLWSDSTNTKPPGATATGWHQDMQAFPFDRPEGGGIWVALCEMTPEMAPLQHLSGSHKSPWEEPDKDQEGYEGSDYKPGKFSYGEAKEIYKTSPSQYLHPGDAIAHHVLTFHGTERGNETDKIRWAWISQRFPADIKYVDKRNVRSDDLGLVPGKELDHPLFPVVLGGG